MDSSEVVHLVPFYFSLFTVACQVHVILNIGSVFNVW